MSKTHHRAQRLSRREVVAGGGLVALAACLFPSPVWATPEEAQKLLATLGPGAPKEGKVTIKAPEIAENGNTVPVTISVDSPMTEGNYVKAIQMVADGNPLPGVARFNLSPANGRAEVQFRIRLARTQNIVAVAEMNDGSLWRASRKVKVTIGGCGG
jgi:sulfur-oxidizing protein SoxY